MGWRRGYYDGSWEGTYGLIGALMWVSYATFGFLIAAIHIGPHIANAFILSVAVLLPLLVGGGVYLGKKRDIKGH